MKIYVGNISFQTDEESLRGLFSNYGGVDEVTVVMDRETGRSRGFAFVSMGNDQEAQAAIEALNDSDFDGRNLKVNEARPREDRSGGGGGFRGGRGGGGGGGYRGGGGGGGRGGRGGGGGGGGGYSNSRDRW